MFFPLLLLLAGTNVRADDIQAVTEVAAAGTPDLALVLLDQHQRQDTSDSRQWMAWERARIEILAKAEEWKRLAGRVAQLPASLPEDFLSWARTRRVEALLQVGDGNAARRQAADLLWRAPAATPSKQIGLWRRELIRAYLAAKHGDDAYLAMLRYGQDYGDGGPTDVILRARVLLATGRNQEALSQLNSASPLLEERALRALAVLRSGGSPRKVMRRCDDLAAVKGASPALQQLIEAVRAEAAQRAGDYANAAISLEKVFARAETTPVDSSLFTLTPDDLWDAYIHYAEQLGNREQMLIGNDQAWFNAAASTAKLYPIRIRSIYALLAFKARSATSRLRAHNALVASLTDSGQGLELVYELYVQSKRFADLSKVPDAVRYVLIDRAIKQHDLGLASRLQVALDAPPPGSDPFTWQLRRAKVFNLAGDFPRSEAVIGELIKHADKYSDPQLDRLMQLLFDLQTVGEHKAAIELFGKLLPKVSELQRRRELYYWMGDSQFALKNYVEAAHLYLRSAILPGPNTMDPWANTARYQAAKALTEAGLLADAHNLYEQLISATDDPARRAVLLHDMEQLRLKANAGS